MHQVHVALHQSAKRGLRAVERVFLQQFPIVHAESLSNILSPLNRSNRTTNFQRRGRSTQKFIGRRDGFATAHRIIRARGLMASTRFSPRARLIYGSCWPLASDGLPPLARAA